MDELRHSAPHPAFGLMHARIPTWFPFRVYVGINGRRWLGLADVAQAQALFNGRGSEILARRSARH